MRVTITHPILDYIVKDSRDHCMLVPAIAGKYHGDVGGMSQVRQLRSLSHLSIVMFRGKCERVIYDIRVAFQSRLICCGTI